MFHEKKPSIFSAFRPKTAFIFGLIIGVLAVGTVGFVVLAAQMASGDRDASPKTAAENNNVNAANQPPTNNVAPTNPAAARASLAIAADDHIRGDVNAPVKIFEFSDFQCPFCSKHHATMQQIMDQYGDKVAWVYKHFPLDSLHPQARTAAEASECVWEQKGNEGFWQFADKLFANQATLGPELYSQVADELNLNTDQFDDCVKSRKYQDKVEAEYQAGVKAGVRGTPGNFVNGISVNGAVPLASFQQIIDSELK